MASLVSEILASAGKLQREELGTKVEKLKRRIEDMKLSVQDVLKKRYVDFLPTCTQTGDMVNKVESYDNELNDIKNTIQNELQDQLEASNVELTQVCQQLREASLALRVVNRFVVIHSTLEDSWKAFNDKDFLQAARSLDVIKEYLKGLTDDWGDRLSVLKGLQTEYLMRREKLMYDLGEAWASYVLWSVADLDFSKGDIEEKKNSLSIKMESPNDAHHLASLVQALQLLNYLDSRLKPFSQRLLKHILTPIVTKNVEVQLIKESECVSLTVILKKEMANESRRPPQEVFVKLQTVIEFLNENLFQVPVAETSDKDKLVLMTCLGRLIYHSFYDLMIKECLSYSVPSNKNDLERFNEVIGQTQSFHNFLLDNKFVTQEDKSLLDYAKNVDSLFANKMCNELLNKARNLMKESLHDCITIQSQEQCKLEPLDMPNAELKGKLPFIHTSVPEPKLSKNTFQFPTCQISKSTIKLKDLLHEILKEAVASQDLCAVRLFSTTRNILELYCDVVTIYHKENLESLPQQSALFYNNCMYLAHHAMTLGHYYKPRLPEPLCDGLTTFVDFVPKFRKLGTDVFLSQMQKQKQQLLGYIQEFGSLQEIVNGNNDISTVERSVKQCILLLQHLQKVWVGILPDNIYLKAIGTLLTTVIEELVTRVTGLEDLPADMAVQLVECFSILENKSQVLFQVSENEKNEIVFIQKYARRWMKFKETIFVLNASLREIDDHWADGKGPLANELTVLEIKQLIRSLFQNSDRRAALLAKIK